MPSEEELAAESEAYDPLPGFEEKEFRQGFARVAMVCIMLVCPSPLAGGGLHPRSPSLAR